MTKRRLPLLTFAQIWNMSFGFLGIQFGFGLQQANMSPIYRYLGADEASLPILWLAGPLTGLLVQPIIGAMSDRTWNRFGRRRPYFLVGAIVASLALIAMPYSPVLWVAASLMWILDASMNVAMEPFRAFVGDKLPHEQRTLGFSVQSFMVGAGQLLSSSMPFILGSIGVATVAASHTVPDFVKYAFLLGAVTMMAAILWTVTTTSEYPPEDMEEFRRQKAASGGILHVFKEVFDAVKAMPKVMRQLWWVKFFTWYGLPLMWQYLSISIARHCYNAPTAESPGFADGIKMGGLAFAVFNVACVAVSFLFPTIASRIGSRMTHALCLTIGGAGFVAMLFTNDVTMVLLCMVPVGVAWGSIMTMPYVMLTSAVPGSRMGVYMGIFNMFVCIPQFVSMMTVPFFYKTILGDDPRHALVLVGICFFLAAAACFLISKQVDEPVDNEDVLEAAAVGAEVSKL